MSKRLAYDQYTVSVPTELADPENESFELFRLAHLEAEERTRTWAMPCEWRFKITRYGFDETEVKVTRVRHRTPRTKGG